MLKGEAGGGKEKYENSFVITVAMEGGGDGDGDKGNSLS